MTMVCVDCGSNKIHSFILKSDNCTYHSVNINVNDLKENKPNYIEGYYCENCGEAVSTKEK